MRLRILFCAAALLTCVFLRANNDTLRVLCIGNSFSVDAVEQELLPMAQAEGVLLMVGNLYIGGCSLERHAGNIQEMKAEYSYRELRNGRRDVYESISLNSALRRADWDIVTMQQASHYSGMWETFEPWLSILIDSVRTICPNAKLAWYMTWAYSQDSDHGGFKNYNCNQQNMYESICQCVDKVLAKYPFDLFIPVGSAVQKARQTRLGDTFCRDGFHLNFEYGRYLAACVWFETLTGKRPHKSKAMTVDFYGPQENPIRVSNRDLRSLRTERICRKAAHKAHLR